MATVEINHTEPSIVGVAKFSAFQTVLSSLDINMNVEFNGFNKRGRANLLGIYNSLSMEERTIVLKYTKMQVVAMFNDAMGTEYTWEQVPNSIFES